MQLTQLPMLLAQVTVEDLEREKIFLQHNYEYLSWGLTAAWIILVVYVLMMIGRQNRLKREISSLRAMLEEKK
ncbi:MAG: CcmD family protein [Acidobacteriia bacterium]|nr:CcmD family protein [Terriglobia bacterium]